MGVDVIREWGAGKEKMNVQHRTSNDLKKQPASRRAAETAERDQGLTGFARGIGNNIVFSAFSVEMTGSLVELVEF
jgi:hypothetical protein